MYHFLDYYLFVTLLTSISNSHVSIAYLLSTMSACYLFIALACANTIFYTFLMISLNFSRLKAEKERTVIADTQYILGLKINVIKPQNKSRNNTI